MNLRLRDGMRVAADGWPSMWKRVCLWIVAAGFAGHMACSDASDDERQDGSDQGAVTVVELAPVARQVVTDSVRTSAIVESEAQADLMPETTGIVRQLMKDEGDTVRAGDLLAVLDNVALGTGAERARGDAARLKAQLDQTQQLLESGAASQKEVDDLRHQWMAAQLAEREAVTVARQTRLTAPFDGVVARRDVRVGELASAGGVAFQIVDPSRLRVVVSLPERDLARVRVGQPARLTAAYDDALRSGGAVARIAPVVDPTSGTVRVTIDVDAEDNPLRPGQFVSVWIEVDRRENVVAVPRSAVVWEDGIPVIYAADNAPTEGDAEDGDTETHEVARRTPVELGLVDDDWAQILSGSKVGERVVIVGQSNLRDGGRIRESANVAAENELPETDEG